MKNKQENEKAELDSAAFEHKLKSDNPSAPENEKILLKKRCQSV